MTNQIINQKSLVTIAMAAYNADKFIEDALKSVFMQSHKNWELIITNDSSTDTTIHRINLCVEKYGIKKEKIKISSNKKTFGYGFSLKNSIEGGSGDLIAILDADDALAMEHSVRIMVLKHMEFPNASLMYSDFWWCDKGLRPQTEKRTRQIKSGEKLWMAHRDGTFDLSIKISHFKVFKRYFYNLTSGIDSTLTKTVDKDLVLKLDEVGDLVHVPELLYFYRNHSGNLTTRFTRFPKEMKRKILEMKKNIFISAIQRRKILGNKK